MTTLDQLAARLRQRAAAIRLIEWQQPSPLEPGFWVVIVEARGKRETERYHELDTALFTALAFLPCPLPSVPVVVPDLSITVEQLGDLLRERHTSLRDVGFREAWRATAVCRRMEAVGAGASLQGAVMTALDLAGAHVCNQLAAATEARADDTPPPFDVGGEGGGFA